MKILVVEDDQLLCEQLAELLVQEGHSPTVCGDGEAGLITAMAEDFEVLIVDRMMPKMDGLTMIGRLRENGNNTPALVLSALGQVDDRVAGLQAGGDDYLVKPYAATELVARVNALARRGEQPSSDTSLQVRDLVLDRIAHQARRAGKDITLQPREYRLLDYLMQNEGKLVTRTMLLQNVWDLNFDPQTNVIDVHVSRLRAKIDKGFDAPLLHTVRGKGYRFAALD